MQQVKNQVSKNEFYFRVLDSIRNDGKLPDLNISKQLMNYYLSPLKKQGIIFKKGYSVWGINEEKLHDQTSKKSSKDSIFSTEIRGHGFVFKVRVKKYPVHMQRILDEQKVPNKQVRPNVTSVLFGNHKIWLCNTHMIVYFPDWKMYFKSSAKEGQQNAIYDLEQLCVGLENKLGIQIRPIRFKVCKQHYAKVKDQLAKAYNDEKRKLECRDENGQLWMLIDKSLSKDELELVHPIKSQEHTDQVIVPFFNDLEHHWRATGEAVKISSILNVLDQQVKNQQYYSENMVSHVKAIQELAQGVKELRIEVKKLRGVDDGTE